MMNWTAFWLGVFLFFILLLVGTYLYLTRTDNGQVIMARMGLESTTAAQWQVGTERMNIGDIDGAIAYYEAAREADGEDQINIDGLLNLASAYEAAGRVNDAEVIYRNIYLNLTPSAPEAYRSEIRLLLARESYAEAAALMQTAFEKTGVNSFRSQRIELLPTAPTPDLLGGYYTAKQYLTLSSTQSYDIWYTFEADPENIPGTEVYRYPVYLDDTTMEIHAQMSERDVLTDVKLATYTLYTEPIFLDEGTWDLRAVTASEQLISDPLKASYKVYMSAPLTPGSSLAPKEYKQRQRIWLKPGKDENGKVPKSADERENKLTFYYTIDGSTPDADSPVYTGEPFWLPGGNVVLRAVAVNDYGKASNMLEVRYKITGAKPHPLSAYSISDLANGVQLNHTTREEFQEKYGPGEKIEEVTLPGFDTGCQRYTYSWGYATMAKNAAGWVLVELDFTSQLSGPRKTGIGNTEAQVVGAFRDMGQVESPSGNRGLYQTDDGSRGKIYKQEDGSKIIRYITETGDGHQWQLDYILSKQGIVTEIYMLYVR